MQLERCRRRTDLVTDVTRGLPHPVVVSVVPVHLRWALLHAVSIVVVVQAVIGAGELREGVHHAAVTLDDRDLIGLRHGGDAVAQRAGKREEVLGTQRGVAEQLVGFGHQAEGHLDGEAPPAPTGGVPHVGAHVHLQVPLGGEGLLAHVTLIRLVTWKNTK